MGAGLVGAVEGVLAPAGDIGDDGVAVSDEQFGDAAAHVPHGDDPDQAAVTVLEFLQVGCCCCAVRHDDHQFVLCQSWTRWCVD